MQNDQTPYETDTPETLEQLYTYGLHLLEAIETEMNNDDSAISELKEQHDSTMAILQESNEKYRCLQKKVAELAQFAKGD